MPERAIKVVHYLNQFFGGVGGEDKAYVEPYIIKGATGPGKAVQNALGQMGVVVATVICGDNYFAENVDLATGKVIQLLTPYQPDAVIAGPAFDAGRYGLACGAVCKAVQTQLGIPGVTGMYKENPSLDLFKADVYIVETAGSVKGMTDAVSRMVKIACKLVTGQKIGPPSEEGYYSRGYITNTLSDRTGAERVVNILLSKLNNQPFQSEIPLPKYDRVKPAAPIKDSRSATIALVTDGGLFPRGNPDKIESRGATHYGSYSIHGVKANNPEQLEVNHTGYNPAFVVQDPNRLVPVDVMLDLEKEGRIKKLHEVFYSTAGAVGVLENEKKMGQSLAEKLKSQGISGVILTST